MFHRYYSSLEVASEYFRSGADKVSIGSDAVYAAEEYLKTKVLPSVLVHLLIIWCLPQINVAWFTSLGKNWKD